MLSASVIIANWNGARHLRVCLESLRRQTHPDFEVIVVDNGSTDDSVAMVQQAYPDVQLLALPENCGFVVACNRGAALARGEVLVMLNNDTEAEPGWLEALCRALEAHPEAGAAASKLLLFDRRDTLHSAGDILGPDFMPANRGVWEVDRGQYDHDRWVFGACGGAAAYRRTVWEQLGGFDERLYMYLEDVDLAWRMQRAGWRTLFVPEARVYHHLSATGGGRIASYYVGRNTVLLHRRYLRPHQWVRALPGHARVVWQALRAWRGEAARARLLGVWHGLLGKEGKTF